LAISSPWRTAAIVQYVLSSGLCTGVCVAALTNANNSSQAKSSCPRVPFPVTRKFFLDDDDWLKSWASRYGDSGARALAEELRRLPWRAGRG
jgi:hypothetical protein